MFYWIFLVNILQFFNFFYKEFPGQQKYWKSCILRIHTIESCMDGSGLGVRVAVLLLVACNDFDFRLYCLANKGFLLLLLFLCVCRSCLLFVRTKLFCLKFFKGLSCLFFFHKKKKKKLFVFGKISFFFLRNKHTHTQGRWKGVLTQRHTTTSLKSHGNF